MKLLFMGRKPVAARLLERYAGHVVGVLTDSHLEGSVTAAKARELGLPVLTYEDALDLDFDLGVSVLYWRKLKGRLLNSINFHPAPLPDYKGVGGYNLGILDGLDQWGVSAHYVDAEIDTGPIIAVDRFPIGTETARSLEAKSMAALEAQAVRILDDLVANPRRLPTTPNEGGRHLTRRELEAMKRIEPGDDIARKVRAFWFPPYDGAYIEHAGERFTLVDRGILESLADPSVSSLFSPKAG